MIAYQIQNIPFLKKKETTYSQNSYVDTWLKT